jgi:LPS export ABC transporter protein LptC
VGYKVGETMWLRKVREIEKNPLSLLDSLPEAALQVKEFHRSMVKDGQKIWEIAGQEAQYLSEQKEIVVQKPRFSYYGKKGETLEARAEEGRIYLAEKEIDRMELSGNTTIGYQGFVLETDKILYHKDKDEVRLPGRVSLKGEGLDVEGVGMTIALHEEKVRLQSKVKTKIEPDRLRARLKSKENNDKKS